MSRFGVQALIVALAVVCTVTAAGAHEEQNRKLLSQRPGIHLNDKDVEAVQRKADKDAAKKFQEAVAKYADHPHKSGWAKFQLKSDKEKKEWEAKRASFTGEPGSNKRKSGSTGYKGFVSKTLEGQKKWLDLNKRALAKGQIFKLPGVIDQPYRGKEYKKNEGQGIAIKKTDKEGIPLSS